MVAMVGMVGMVARDGWGWWGSVLGGLVVSGRPRYYPRLYQKFSVGGEVSRIAAGGSSADGTLQECGAWRRVSSRESDAVPLDDAV
jgi:hypothetical protein